MGIDSTRQLTVERENEITSNLPFVSAISDDNQKVMVACVEELVNREGITI